MNVKIRFDAPLQNDDAEDRAYGCRQNNPDICKNNSVLGICAFANPDGICHNTNLILKQLINPLTQGDTFNSRIR